LKAIFEDHPLWPFINSILEKGASYPLDYILEDIRKGDIIYHKERGNHKSATKYSKMISSIIKEDVERGFALILPIQLLEKNPNASLAPLGCIKQHTINALGERTTKFRMTHNQSFPGPSGTSVNMTTQQNKLPPIVYGFCLKQ